MPVPPSSRQFQALPCWLWPACSLCSGSPCSGSFQANLHRPVPFLPDCQHSALRIPFVFRTISLWAARLFAVFPFIMLTSCSALLLRVFFNTSTQMRLQDLPGYSHVLFLLPATFTEKRFRVAIGLCFAMQTYPRLRPYMRFLFVRPELCPFGELSAPIPAFFRFRPTADTLAFG